MVSQWEPGKEEFVECFGSLHTYCVPGPGRAMGDVLSEADVVPVLMKHVV